MRGILMMLLIIDAIAWRVIGAGKKKCPSIKSCYCCLVKAVRLISVISSYPLSCSWHCHISSVTLIENNISIN